MSMALPKMGLKTRHDKASDSMTPSEWLARGYLGE